MGAFSLFGIDLFGTFQKEEESDPVVYGITTNIHTYNLLQDRLS
jgi:hypothetical protein